jgi:ABC-type sulfate transport system permease component
VSALALLAGFICLPLLSLVTWTVNEGAWRAMASQIALDALLLSAKTTAVTMAIIFIVGTPAAFLLARAEFPGKRLVNTWWTSRRSCPQRRGHSAPARAR